MRARRCSSPMRRPSSSAGAKLPPARESNSSGTSRSMSSSTLTRRPVVGGSSSGCDSASSKNRVSASENHEYASRSFGTNSCITASVAVVPTLRPVRYSSAPASAGACSKSVRSVSARPISTSGFSPRCTRRMVFRMNCSSNAIDVFDCSPRSTLTGMSAVAAAASRAQRSGVRHTGDRTELGSDAPTARERRHDRAAVAGQPMGVDEHARFVAGRAGRARARHRGDPR